MATATTRVLAPAYKFSADGRGDRPRGRSSQLLISSQISEFQFINVPSLRSFRTNPRRQRFSTIRGSIDPVPHLPSDPSSGSWKLWIVGIFISVILPFCRNKWGPLWKLKNEAEAVVETAEHVTDMVEKVAEEVEKVAEEVADNLPKGGKLKDAATLVEKVAKEIAKDAHLMEDIIDKAEEVEKDVDSFMEPSSKHASDMSGPEKEQN